MHFVPTPGAAACRGGTAGATVNPNSGTPGARHASQPRLSGLGFHFSAGPYRHVVRHLAAAHAPRRLSTSPARSLRLTSAGSTSFTAMSGLRSSKPSEKTSSVRAGLEVGPAHTEPVSETCRWERRVARGSPDQVRGGCARARGRRRCSGPLIRSPPWNTVTNARLTPSGASMMREPPGAPDAEVPPAQTRSAARTWPSSCGGRPLPMTSLQRHGDAGSVRQVPVVSRR